MPVGIPCSGTLVDETITVVNDAVAGFDGRGVNGRIRIIAVGVIDDVADRRRATAHGTSYAGIAVTVALGVASHEPA